MFNRKFSSSIRLKRRMIRSIIILLVVCLGIGYSAFTTNLGINGTLNVSKYDHTLYGVLEKAGKKGVYATEYTGAHHDSFTIEPTKKIYNWYAPQTTDGYTLAQEIMNNKWNVIFANHCWQMIRTTDTGGVKMVYNGEAENGQCLSTRSNHVGYSQRNTQTMSTTYYYGTDYTYDKTNNVFSLDGTVTTGTIKLGQYTCRSTSSSGTCGTLYLVDTLSSGSKYNVIPLTGNASYAGFGNLHFNQPNNSAAYLGYMYNTVYPNETYSINHFSIGGAGYSINRFYYYSDTIDYNTINPGKYTLVNPHLISDLSDYNDLVGKYVLDINGTSVYDDDVYYVIGVDNDAFSIEQLTDGDLNISLTVGDSYTENNGIYTLTNPVNISFIDWYGNIDDYNIYKGKYVCDGNNTSCSTLKRIYSGRNIYHGSYDYYDTDNKYSFYENMTYNNGSYTLSGDVKTFWDFSDSTFLTTLSTHHYSCLNSLNTCTDLKYIVSASDNGFSYYNLSNVANVSTALNNMLNVDNVNQVDSTIKKGVDAWYKKYLTAYTNKIEDTIYCNDRSITSIGAWNPNGGKVTGEAAYLQFKNYITDVYLTCENTTDKFSTANSKARLTYPIGLLTYSEAKMLGGYYIRNQGVSCNLMTPSYSIGIESRYLTINTSGVLNHSSLASSASLRPAISLKPGTEYVSGTGSMADPYVVQ